MVKTITCPLCGSQADEVMHKLVDGVAVTSDSNYSTSLDPYLVFCANCSYWFTHQGRSLNEFYAGEYVLLMQDFFTDQVLLVNEQSMRRAEYQASLIRQVARALGSRRLLEVGAGKGLTAYHVVCSIHPEEIVLHDPGAKRYESMWLEYVRPTSSHVDLAELREIKFDLGYTFFTFEHTERPVEDMDILMSALQDNGVFMGVVPWLCANPGDLLVGDHCSHFTAASLARMLGRYKSLLGVNFRLLINAPLRALVYVCSKSEVQLGRVVDTLTSGESAGDFKPAEQMQETPDSELRAIAERHWRVESSASGTKQEILWGAGFYSKLIMLRHHSRNFSVCIDSNPSLVGTEFTDPAGRVMRVAPSNEWLAAASGNDRLWLGVSAAARASILKVNGGRLSEAGVEVAF